ncbi:hypothetical protein [Streptacidiphilus melanogenes]|nr:hypothetical protein [Streptacidiphilus melanogenes]
MSQDQHGAGDELRDELAGTRGLVVAGLARCRMAGPWTLVS